MAEVGHVTGSNFEAEVLNSDIPVLVDFWAPWCAPCHMVAPIVEKIAERFAGKLKVVKLNVDEAPELANQYRIRGIPALLLFKNGEVVNQLIGAQPENAIATVVEQVIGE